MFDSSNPYFSAGFGLLGVGAVMAATKSGLTRLCSLAQRRYLTTIEINSRDPAYRWMNSYLARINCPSGSHSSLQSGPSGSVSMIPAPGTHYFKVNEKWFRLERSRERSSVDVGVMPFETVSLSCLGKQSQEMAQFVDDIVREGKKQELGKMQIYTAFASEWRPFGSPRKPRPLDSVIFKKNQLETLISDINRFLGNSSWYEERGIPYRRGYLLHGPPGCGKSSAIQAIAGQLGYGLAVLGLSDRSLSDDRLAFLLNNLPEKTLILLEDIDTVVPGRNISNAGGISLSGLLNAIDGAVASEERMIFMTTNHLDLLDSALIRPGRIDVKLEIGEADEEQASRMFRRFYHNIPHDSFAEAFARHACALTPAVIQGILINNPDNPKGALSAVSCHYHHQPPPQQIPMHR